MPHCIVEYAASLRGSVDWHDVLGALHRVLLESGQFAAADIRCRAIAYEDFSLGDGQAFVALTIKMLDGRSDEIRSRRELSPCV